MTASSHLAIGASALVKTFGTTRAVHGIDLNIPAGSDARAVRDWISLTGQYVSLDDGLTARENLDLPPAPR